MRTPRTALLLALLVVAGPACTSRAGVTEEQAARYRGLRKEFFLVVALEPGDGKRPRKEHREFLKKVSAFAEQVATSSPAYATASHYLKARMLLKIGQAEAGRRSFDACLEMLAEAAKKDEPLPPGTPSECTIRIFRAFSFFGEGNAKVIAELEAIPPDIEKPKYHEVGEPLSGWAEALENRQEDADALRVYLLIKRWELWQEEAQNPDRKIRLIRLRTGEQPAPTEQPTAAPVVPNDDNQPPGE